VRPAAGAAAHGLAPGSGTGAPDAGAGKGRGGGGAADGVPAEDRQDGLYTEAPAEGRPEPERAALATVYSGMALCAEVKGASSRSYIRLVMMWAASEQGAFVHDV